MCEGRIELALVVVMASSATTVTEELWLAHKHLHFTREEITRVVLYGFESAFLPHREREALVAKVKKELEAIQ